MQNLLYIVSLLLEERRKTMGKFMKERLDLHFYLIQLVKSLKNEEMSKLLDMQKEF